MPNVILEAMFHGISIVATNVGGVPDIVDHDRTGIVVNQRCS
jgi:teichuronic acid biosynthesis glycosyltransferase TuaC